MLFIGLFCIESGRFSFIFSKPIISLYNLISYSQKETKTAHLKINITPLGFYNPI